VRTGNLSVTRYFRAGESSLFGLGTTVSFNTREASVPVPEMLWPTLAGLVGIASVQSGDEAKLMSLGCDSPKHVWCTLWHEPRVGLGHCIPSPARLWTRGFAGAGDSNRGRLRVCVGTRKFPAALPVLAAHYQLGPLVLISAGNNNAEEPDLLDINTATAE
jgi:hypothetical protein